MRDRPSPRAICKHIDSDNPRNVAGVIPWSLRQSVLDVDVGNPADLTSSFPPWLSLNTSKETKYHFYYPDTKPRGNADFEFLGTSGQIRSNKGFVILWDQPNGRGSGIEILADRFRTYGKPTGDDTCLFPAEEVLGRQQTREVPEETGERVHSLPEVPGFDPWLMPDIDRFDWNPFEEFRRARPGNRHTKLFSALRAGVIYDIRRGVCPPSEQRQGKDKWIVDRILGIAFQLNQTNECPLEEWEVRNIAGSICRYYFADQLNRTSRSQRELRLLGYAKRGKGQYVDRKENARTFDQRDQSIVLRNQNGESQLTLAKAFGLTQQGISKIIRRQS